MTIRTKIILVVVPLLATGLLITGIFSSFSARTGMTRIAMESLGFKAEELQTYATSQWNLLVSNDLADRTEYVEITKKAIASYAESLIRSDSELILAVDADLGIVLSTDEVTLDVNETIRMRGLVANAADGWVETPMGGRNRVGSGFGFEPFGWYVLVTEDTAEFYREVTDIQRQSVYILSGSLFLSFILLLAFTGYLTRPLRRVVSAMRDIIQNNDLTRRVEVEFRDEIGELANAFNLMVAQLGRAYGQIKEFAFKAVLAQKNEHKVRNIFQKYVPKDVIDSLFMHPEQMLVGNKRELAILFSDIRNFTTLSEGFRPEDLVTSLNEYFGILVEIIIENDGIVDKYIGDAIMAFFGAPVSHDNDPEQAVGAALQMQAALNGFNSRQTKSGNPPFKTGIGINFGIVTVGNIGTEKKMDYTVIGDMVNLGSRLEGLTKVYDLPLIFSESVYRRVKSTYPCRMVDKVLVKGKTTGERIFTASKSLDGATSKAWKYHHAGLKSYYARDFGKSSQYFRAARELLPEDRVSQLFLERSAHYRRNPPPKNWNGQEKLLEK